MPLTVLLVLLALSCGTFSALLATAASVPPVGQQRFPGIVHKSIVNAEFIGYGSLLFPESVTFDRQGLLYVSLADGSIRTLNTTSLVSKHWAYVVPNLSPVDRAKCGTDPTYNLMCGRPLGIAFDANERYMYVADETRGLLRINAQRPSQVQVLATEHEGRPFRITNSLVVSDDGRFVYFTVSNDEYYFVDFVKLMLASRETGRLMRYDLQTGKVVTLMDGLRVPNGLTLAGPEPKEYLVVAISGTGQLFRYWIEGPNAGTFELFIEDLGGYPDNVTPDGDGGFYVSLLSSRSEAIDDTASNEQLKSVHLNDLVPPYIPLTWLNFFANIKHYNNKGKLIEVIADVDANVVGPMSGAYFRDGYFYGGSFMAPVLTRVGLYDGDTVVVRIEQ